MSQPEPMILIKIELIPSQTILTPVNSKLTKGKTKSTRDIIHTHLCGIYTLNYITHKYTVFSAHKKYLISSHSFKIIQLHI